jgi:chromosomal replication initiation ATPase DnaA
MGGNHAERAYRRFVEQGLTEPPESPFRNAAFGWLLGSQSFVDRIRKRMKRPHFDDDVPLARRIANLEPETVIATVADYYGISPASFQRRRSGDDRRDVAAYLARRLTITTLRELAGVFGLTHPGSVSNLLRRAEDTVTNSKHLRQDIDAIRKRLAKTKNEV